MILTIIKLLLAGQPGVGLVHLSWQPNDLAHSLKCRLKTRVALHSNFCFYHACALYEMSKQTLACSTKLSLWHMWWGNRLLKHQGQIKLNLVWSEFLNWIFKCSVHHLHVVYDRFVNGLEHCIGIGLVYCSKKCDFTTREIACFHFAHANFRSYWLWIAIQSFSQYRISTQSIVAMWITPIK